jgi:hypothetical protein
MRNVITPRRSFMAVIEAEHPACFKKGFAVNSEGELFKDGELVRGDVPEAAEALKLWDFLAGQYRSFGKAREGGQFSVIECCAMPTVCAPEGPGSEIGFLEFEFSTMQNIEHEEGKLKGYDPKNFEGHPGEAEVLEALKLLQADLIEGDVGLIMDDDIGVVFCRLVPWPDRPHYYSLVLWAKAEHKEHLIPVSELVSTKIKADPCLDKAHERIG